MICIYSDQILLSKQKTFHTGSFRYVIPGGKFNHRGEAPEACAQRELWEETGIRLHTNRLQPLSIEHDSVCNRTTHFFTATLSDEEFQEFDYNFNTFRHPREKKRHPTYTWRKTHDDDWSDLFELDQKAIGALSTDTYHECIELYHDIDQEQHLDSPHIVRYPRSITPPRAVLPVRRHSYWVLMATMILTINSQPSCDPNEPVRTIDAGHKKHTMLKYTKNTIFLQENYRQRPAILHRGRGDTLT